MPNKYLILLVMLYFTSCKAQQVKYTKSDYEKYMLACDNYVKNYKAYSDSISDTTFIYSPRILMPPDSINKFLFYCIAKKDYSPLKYAIVIVVKQGVEHDKRNIDDVHLGTLAGCENGFVEMIKINMGIPRYWYDKKYKEEGKQCWFPRYFRDVVLWAEKNKKKIKDYEYIEQFNPDNRRL